jgi:hypothetical protein
MTNGNGLRLYDNHRPSPISLPPLRLPPIDHALKAEQLAEHATIRAGRDAWQAIGKANNFASWKLIGAALSVGKIHSMRVANTNRAWGRNYSRAFCDWSKQYHFDTMHASVRSAAITMYENIQAIEAWRETLSEKERRSFNHPLSNVKRWKLVTAHGPGKSPQDLKRDATAAWRRFIACTKALPQDQAEPLLQIARAELCL